MTPHFSAFLILFLLFLVPHGISTPLAEVSTEAVELDPDATTTAELAVLRLRHVTRDAPLAAPDFHLQARHIHIEADHTDTFAQQIVISPGIQTTPLHNGPGSLTGTTNRINHNLWITPIDAAAFNAEGPGRLTPSNAESVTWEPMVNQARDDHTTHTATAATWTMNRSATATITGSLQLRLWEWDVVLDADGQRTTHRSGVQGPVSSMGAGSADELIVTAIDAVLTIPLTPTTYALYLGSVQAHAASVSLQNATGNLLDLTTPIAGDLDLTGDLLLGVTATDADAPLQARVSGTVQEADLDGAPLALPASRIEPGVAVAPVFLAGAAALVVIVAFLRRRRGPRVAAAEGPPSASAPPRAGPGAGDADAERAVLRVVRRHPGVTVRRLQARAGVSKERCAAAIQALVDRGEVVRQGSEARWHFFPASMDLDSWQQVAALQDPNLRLLYDVVREHAEAEQRAIVAAASMRWDWPASTTKARLRRLADVGLVQVTKNVPATRSVPRGTVFVTSAPAPPTGVK